MDEIIVIHDFIDLDYQEKIKSTQVNLIGTGKATRQFTYAGDVAKLIKDGT